MRKVVKDLNHIPSRLINPKAMAALLEVIQTRDANKISGDIYKGIYKSEGKSRSEVHEFLNAYYFDKCAYCESHNNPEIEHYRPKGRVTEDTNHPGYYWLCYEWTNLIPSCHDCNAVNGKLNQFPILGTRLMGPVLSANRNLDPLHQSAHTNLLLAERPYLIHPEIDDPANYLGFEIDPEGVGIKIIGIDQEGRGERSIQICDLNRRYLKLNRLEILDHDIKALNKGIHLFETGNLDLLTLKEYYKITFEDIDADINDVQKTHTLLRKYAFGNIEQFKTIILPKIAQNAQAIILEAFKYYRTDQ
jgi:hypothetical protein